MECAMCNQTLMDGVEHTTCASCGNVVCEQCTRRCAQCGIALCDDCTRLCNSTEDLICSGCSTRCDICEETVRSDLVTLCDCGDHCHCPDCQWGRSGCGCRVAPCDTTTCHDCGATVCGNCSYYCEECGENFCESCFNRDEGSCNSCSGNNGIIKDYSTKPCWTCTHGRCETRSARGVYLGIELELNFDTNDIENINDIVARYIPTNRYLFKYDSSIGEGAELVIHPHTLAALKELKLKDMLSDLSKAGVTSYESGHCGLHVHIERDCSNLRYWIEGFIWHSRDEMFTFSKRGRNQYNNYCKIKSMQSGRNCAVNMYPTETVEIRLFRGTTNFERIWASLQMCDALNTFCSLYGRQCLRRKLWDEFLVFIKPRYGALSRYIAKHMQVVKREDGSSDRAIHEHDYEEESEIIEDDSDSIPF